MNKKHYGAFNITKALGLSLDNYMKVGSLLSLIGAPMMMNDKRVKTYYLTQNQVNFLKRELMLIKSEMNKVTAF